MAAISWMSSLSVWLAFSMTTFLVTSRVALLWLVRLYKYEQIHPTTWYLIVLFLIQAPYLSSLIHLLWNTPLISAARRESLPRRSHVTMGVLASILEAVAVSMFATEVIHVLPEPVLLTLPYTSLAFLVWRDVRNEARVQAKMADSTCTSWSLRYLSNLASALIVGCLFLVPLVTGITLCVWSNFRMSVEECIVLTFCILFLAVVWSPEVQQTITTSHKTGKTCLGANLLYLPVKMVASVVALFLSMFFKLGDFRDYMSECLRLAFREFTDMRVWLTAFICCLGAFCSFLSAMAASKVCLVKAGMKIPMFSCPLLAILVSAVLWNDLETEAFWEVVGDDLHTWIAIGLSSVTWLVPYALPAFRGFKLLETSAKDQQTGLVRTLFWCPLFLEPRMLLSNNSKSDNVDFSSTDDKIFSGQKKSVFICTTMYKENEAEMKRYLRSIQNVFANNEPSLINIEAHIFFDSSVHGNKINPRGRQLLFLLCDMFGLRQQDLGKLSTPYGCQVFTPVAQSFTVFIHFKDATKVKAKKRWSQVMYMHYLLRYRSYKPHTTQPFCAFYQPTSEIRKNNADAMFYGGNDLNFTKTPSNHFHLVETGSINSTNASTATTSDASFSPNVMTKNQSQTSERDVDITASNCWWSKESVESEDSAQEQLNLAPSPRMPEAEAQNLQCACKTNSSYPAPGYLWLGRNIEGGERGHLCCRQTSFSTVTSEKCTTSSSASSSSNTYLGETANKTHVNEAFLRHKVPLDSVFLLTTDADTEFSAASIVHLLEQCESDPNLGAVCGRTTPVGSAKPIVWYQKFEYAKDFWLVKSSQNVIGSVTCCPGCFSVYRGSAVVSIVDEFSQPACSAFDNLVMDHGEDRWLCTLLMQRGWRLAYSSDAHNSTHCPETIGEFLRQRRRWVLSELSNMAAIFMSVPNLVRNNSAFSGMFLVSLFTTFLWVVLSPSTTLVFMSAGLEVLFSVPLSVTLPLAVLLFVVYTAVCCKASQSHQKMLSLAVTGAMAVIVVTLGVGFVLYVAMSVDRDIRLWGAVQFRPYFLVFLLVSAIVYAALLHPRESLSLVYGLAYACLFPAMFLVLPGYALSNMLDQSWGTREAGSHGCCQEPEDDEDDLAFPDFSTTVSYLPSLETCQGGEGEHAFWKHLITSYIGTDVNLSKSAIFLSRDLCSLRRRAIVAFVIVNLFWFSCLGALYASAGSDVICYGVASAFSFSLFVQLIGLTCYKINKFLDRYLLKRSNEFVTNISKY